MMNIWMELDRLPRSSAMTIIGQLMRKHGPGVAELAYAMQVSEPTIYRWLRYERRQLELTPAAKRLGLDSLVISGAGPTGIGG